MGELTFLALLLGATLPVLALEWLAGWRTLLEARRPLLVATAMATLYLGLAVTAAIHDGVFDVPGDRALPLRAGPFVFEAWLLILLTNLAIVQSVILAFDVPLRERLRLLLRR